MANGNNAIGLLVIGNEILSGKVRDTNSWFASRLCFRRGLELEAVRVIGDAPGRIKDTVAEMARAHAWVVTSGGVGPTHDDITMECVAAAFGLPLVCHPEMLENLRLGYGDKFNETAARMAYLPEGATIKFAGRFGWPLIRLENIYILPGVPRLFQAKFAAICDEMGGTPRVLQAVITQLDETQFAAELAAVARAHPTVIIGSYPKWHHPAYRVKITFDGENGAEVTAARLDFIGNFASGVFADW